MNQLDIRELPLSAKVAITWEFFWRGILTFLLASVLGFLLLLLPGLAMSWLGLLSNDKAFETFELVGRVAVPAVYLFALYFYVRWLLTSQLGAYRLVLVPAEIKSHRSQPTESVTL
jgi:hypothetical protein